MKARRVKKTLVRESLEMMRKKETAMMRVVLM